MIPDIPKVKTRNMSKRERVKAMTPEIKYALGLAEAALLRKHDALGSGVRVNLYLGFTTELKSRNAFHLHCVHHATIKLPFIIMAAGRIGKHDGAGIPPTFEILESPGWSTNLEQKEFEDLVTLIDCLTLLIDANYYISTTGREHAPFCRHQPISESIPLLRKAIDYVCATYPKEMANGPV